MPSSVDHSLQEALREFQGALTPAQKQQLEAIKAVPDAAAVITFTAQLDEQNAKRRSCGVATRLYTLLQSVQQFSSVVSTLVSSHPTIAALIASNFTSYFDKLSTLFMGFNKLCPRFDEYRILYPQSPRLQTALCDFHASIIRCCKQALQALQRPWSAQVVNALWRSFQTEFEPYEAEVKRCSKEVKEEIYLANAQAAHQDQQLVRLEQEAASKHRRAADLFFQGAGKENDESRRWRVQRDERKSRKHRQQLLDSLSTYDYLAAFKQARKKRHGNTTQWLTRTSEMDRWLNDPGCPVFWCSGKLGSGKTVLTTNVVDHLFLNRHGPDVCISFFFCRFDEAVSLKAETILRSVIRQSLNVANLPKDIESSLERISQNPSSGTKELQALLESLIAMSRAYYIVIDALDECEKYERDIVLDVLQSVVTSSQSKAKILLASRDSIGEEIKRRFPSLQRVSTSSSDAQFDIAIYTREAIDEKLRNRDLVVGNDDLVKEIQDALIQGAQGMFLWVAFEIDDICAQCSDEEIRQVLRSLPKDLTETFNRALLRVLASRKEKIAKQVFRWVAAAKRPLSLQELREAIAVEPCQPYSEPDRLVNDMHRITSWCENLIVLDEEDDAVQFAHHTVKQYFLGPQSDQRLSGFHFELSEADHEAGEICVTYLNFNDFRTQLIRLPRPQAPITPDAIIGAALGGGTKLTAAASLLRSVVRRSSRKSNNTNVVQQLASYGGRKAGDSSEKLDLGHPFLRYASENWLLHTANFEDSKSKTYRLWTQLLEDEQTLGRTPWTHEQFLGRNVLVGDWIAAHHHHALLHRCEEPGSDIYSNGPIGEEDCSLSYMSPKHNLALFRLSVAGRFWVWHRDKALLLAAAVGHLKVVEVLLAAGVDSNAAGVFGTTPLHAAARGGHLEAIERLLAANANVNAVSSDGWTPLHEAASGGHLRAIERLLAANANVNAVSSDGWTPLHAAASGGHLEAIERLLEAGADLYALNSNGETPLQMAHRKGHLEVKQRLKSAAASK
ncbi:hypothetical protein H2201_005165 [Coniosporium apollinis]|uniref:NACHT domain-containing protein n=1 Tax=Coniosporium apollinis TaxID=61459 RepID=A0ABQ9NVZ7_9PEZI|nr:hypothetical protein H2201_005165 [Coniosporium apollinis]